MERIQGFLLALYNSPFLDRLSQIANRAYLKGGQSAHSFILKKLDNYMKEEAWGHLLDGIKPDELTRLRGLLNEKRIDKKDEIDKEDELLTQEEIDERDH